MEQFASSPAWQQSISEHFEEKLTSCRPGGGKTIFPTPMAVRLAADLRPSADESTVRTFLVADQLQAASVPIA